MNEILEQIQILSRSEKLALIRDITLSLEDEELSFADAVELERRLALADANPLEGDSWSNIRVRLEAKVLQAEPQKVAA